MLIAFLPEAFACFCSPAVEFALWPEDGEEEVPVNVWPAAYYSPGALLEGTTLERAEDGAPVPFDLVSYDGGDAWLAVLRPTEVLEPDTTYSYAFATRRPFGLSPFTFTTGSSTASPPGMVTLTHGDLVNIASDCGGPHYLELHVEGEEHVEVEIMSDLEPTTTFHALVPDIHLGYDDCTYRGRALTYNEILTLRARGVGLDGAVSEWSEPLTFEVPPKACGCSGGGAPAWLAWPLVILVARRRRPTCSSC